MLAACGSGANAPVTGSGAVQAVLPVLAAVGFTTELSGIDSLAQSAARPSAAIGVFAAEYLQARSLSLIQSPLAGVRAQQHLDELNDPVSGSSGTVYALLDELRRAANLDVSDLLNRSTDRAVALDAYLRELDAVIIKGSRANEGLNAEIASITADRKTLQAEITALSKQQKTAAGAGQFQQAGDIQIQLDEAQRRLDVGDRQLQTDKEVQKALGVVAGTAIARKQAIEANREVLIAGLKVVDLPQTPAIGVLENSSAQTSSFKGPFRAF